ncbi:MAG: hypothetical protein K2Q22_03255 [Cytophagales bacterium]|nr:hypothetical protein [Cytophagales bacterium]
MSQKKFTYLFGAGASAIALPVVANFPERILEMANLVSQREDILEKLKSSDKDILLKLIADIRELALEAQEYNSIDTLAKILFLKENTIGLNKLKRTLSAYLCLEQGYKRNDKRYDSFLASIINRKNGKMSLPDNIQILSWNYDYQLELSYSKFRKSSIEYDLNIYPSTEVRGYEKDECFSLFKINGTASAFINNNINFTRDLPLPEFKQINVDGKVTLFPSEDSEFELLRRVTEYDAIYKRRTDTAIHFSWENHTISDNTRDRAKNATKDTNILIVVGYSFPVFNRDIDRELISNMTKLEKVYIQIPEKDIDSVIERFKAIKDFSVYEKLIRIS